MSDACRECGKNFGGMFGVKRVCESTQADFARYGMDVQDVCAKCCASLKERVIETRKNDIREAKQRLQTLIDNVVGSIEIHTTPHDHAHDSGIKGVVSGYSVMGTGLLSEIASAWTDFFGMESNAYQEKIRAAEKKAMDMAKLQAADLGATTISGARLSLSEATAGNGMLILSCVGTALRKEPLAPPVDAYLEGKKRTSDVQGVPLIIVTDAEENYQKLRDIETALNDN